MRLRVGAWPALIAGIAIVATSVSSHAGELRVGSTELDVSGYVKGDVIWDLDQDLGDEFTFGVIGEKPRREHVRLHARQSRLRVMSRSDTAIGEIRSLIEGDFFGAEGTGLHLRHAWAEWDVAPNLTFGIGQYRRNFMSLITGISTVDFNGPAGLIGRTIMPQARLTWHEGPWELAISAEQPSGEEDIRTVALRDGTPVLTAGRQATGASDDLPDAAVRWQYNVPSGHQVHLSGLARHLRTDGARDDEAWGWGVQAGVNINLADVATLSTSAMYGEGLGDYLMGAPFAAWVDPRTAKLRTVEALGLFAGVTISISETTDLNLGWGWTQATGDTLSDAAAASLDQGVEAGTITRETMSVHANVMWQPARDLRLGWEVMWGRRGYLDLSADGIRNRSDAMRTQFGAWFFF